MSTQMITKKIYFHVFVILLFACTSATIGNAQIGNVQIGSAQHRTSVVGGGCDGCELMYVGMPKHIKAVDTSAGWRESGTKLLLTGKVYQADGRTPAANVILYYWHTDNNGYYSPRAGMDERAKQHGHIRGWIKTDAEGNYALYTIRPKAYPNRTIPQHIHFAIKEPTIANEYYIDDIVFDDDPLLLPDLKRHPPQKRGGSGIVRIVLAGNLHVAEHPIVLGMNIPNYPTPALKNTRSGLQIGDDSPSFMPFHAWGPDAGTRACPVCKYGRFHGVLYFVGNKPNWEEIKQWLVFLEDESLKRGNELKVYFIYGNEIGYSAEQRKGALASIGKELRLSKIALTFVPSLSDAESDVYLNKINPDAENTFIIYNHRKIVDTFTNLKPSAASFTQIRQTLERTKGKYFHLLAPSHSR